jgi:hypothetical protein
MRKPTPVEEEINAIRLALYEEIKDMSPSEMNAYIKKKVAPLEKEFGIHPVKAPPPRELEERIVRKG